MYLYIINLTAVFMPLNAGCASPSNRCQQNARAVYRKLRSPCGSGSRWNEPSRPNSFLLRHNNAPPAVDSVFFTVSHRGSTLLTRQRVNCFKASCVTTDYLPGKTAVEKTMVTKFTRRLNSLKITCHTLAAVGTVSSVGSSVTAG